MEDLIDGKRRIQAVVCRGENGPGDASFLFDRAGRLLAFEGTMSGSEAFGEMLSQMCRNQPGISGREGLETEWEGVAYHVCLNRYIHLTLGELADIQAQRFPFFFYLPILQPPSPQVYPGNVSYNWSSPDECAHSQDP